MYSTTCGAACDRMPAVTAVELSLANVAALADAFMGEGRAFVAVPGSFVERT